MAKNIAVLLQLLACFLAAGCAGTRTFHEFARPGDTVALAAGWQNNFFRDNITVTIYPADGGSNIVLGPGDSAIRAVVNFYPDPISSVVVSDRTQLDITPSATTYASSNTFNSGNARDWWQTVVFVDLPTNLPPGVTWLVASDPTGSFKASSVDVVAGIGSPNTFSAQNIGALTRQQLAALARVSFHEISFDGNSVPDAIQLEMSHDTGVGSAYTVSPISGVCNISWTDDGSTLKVIITSSADGQVRSISDFKFYVAGGLQNLSVANIQAFDVNGSPVPSVGVDVTYTQTLVGVQ